MISKGKEYLVGYQSEKLDDSEVRWHIVEKEAYAMLRSTEKFRHYLIGKKFVLKTDNRVLSYMKTSKSKKLSNWALQLSDFNFDIVHVPSKNNEISDFFSRLYESVTLLSDFVPSITINDLLIAQKSDPIMSKAFDYLKQKRHFDVNKLGSLKRYRKLLTVDVDGVLRWKTKIVLPEKFITQVLANAHDHPTAGHFAEDRTWTNVSALFFWPEAHNDVVNWVRSCKKCCEYAIKPYVNRPLQPIDSNNRFELVCYDLAGPFIESSNGNTHALIIVDHFSKWPEILPLSNTRGVTIAREIFEQWCCRYGMMTQLHSDGAQNVHSEVIKELCKLIGTVKSKSSRLHPQGDGMAEAMVKIMKQCVKKQVDSHGKDWDLYLQPTAFAVRSSINSGTKHTPAELVLGENVMRPIDLSAPNLIPPSFATKQANKFAKDLSSKIKSSSEIVNKTLTKSRDAMKRTYDRKKSRHSISVGDSVMLWWPYFKKGVSRTFQARWRGPYVVRQLFGDTNCSITMKDGSIKNVHLNQLKPVLSRSNHLQNHNPPEYRTQTTEYCDELPEVLHDDTSTVYDSAVEELSDNDDNDRWCGIDAGNMVEARTRSGQMRVGDG